MTEFETYKTPKIGNWVIINLVDESWSSVFVKFSQDRMFNIIDIVPDNTAGTSLIEYILDIEGYSVHNTVKQVSVNIDEIKDFGTKEEMEIILQANKYNI